jgi:hypothetical protein
LRAAQVEEARIKQSGATRQVNGPTKQAAGEEYAAGVISI